MTHSTTAISRPRVHPVLGVVLLLGAVLLASGCSKPVERTEDVRPVRAIQLAADHADVLAEFSGDVRARVESRLGFRVPGKIVARKVEVGTVVKRGQVLMQLPLTALVHDRKATAVWVVDEGSVRLAPVQVVGNAGNDVMVAGEVAPGQTIVTAGVNLLQPGQKVKLLGADTAAEAIAAATAGPKAALRTAHAPADTAPGATK